MINKKRNIKVQGDALQKVDNIKVGNKQVYKVIAYNENSEKSVLWENKNKYHVYFNYKHGTGSSLPITDAGTSTQLTQIVEEGSCLGVWSTNYSTLLNTYATDGYTFKYFIKGSNTSAQYTAQALEDIVIEEDTTFTAVYSLRTLALTVKKPDNTYNYAVYYLEYNDNVMEILNQIEAINMNKVNYRYIYTFVGWSTNGDNIINITDDTVITNDMTVYPCYTSTEKEFYLNVSYYNPTTGEYEEEDRISISVGDSILQAIEDAAIELGVTTYQGVMYIPQDEYKFVLSDGNYVDMSSEETLDSTVIISYAKHVTGIEYEIDLRNVYLSSSIYYQLKVLDTLSNTYIVNETGTWGTLLTNTGWGNIKLSIDNGTYTSSSEASYYTYTYSYVYSDDTEVGNADTLTKNTTISIKYTKVPKNYIITFKDNYDNVINTFEVPYLDNITDHITYLQYSSMLVDRFITDDGTVSYKLTNQNASAYAEGSLTRYITTTSSHTLTSSTSLTCNGDETFVISFTKEYLTTTVNVSDSTFNLLTNTTNSYDSSDDVKVNDILSTKVLNLRKNSTYSYYKPSTINVTYTYHDGTSDTAKGVSISSIITGIENNLIAVSDGLSITGISTKKLKTIEYIIMSCETVNFMIDVKFYHKTRLLETQSVAKGTKYNELSYPSTSSIQGFVRWGLSNYSTSSISTSTTEILADESIYAITINALPLDRIMLYHEEGSCEYIYSNSGSIVNRYVGSSTETDNLRYITLYLISTYTNVSITPNYGLGLVSTSSSAYLDAPAGSYNLASGSTYSTELNPRVHYSAEMEDITIPGYSGTYSALKVTAYFSKDTTYGDINLRIKTPGAGKKTFGRGEIKIHWTYSGTSSGGD